MKNDTETAILRAAEKLFAEKGYKGATTTLIAAEAGVTHAMLHYYFRTKDQIFLKVVNNNAIQMHDEMKAMMRPVTSVKEITGDIVETYFDYMKKHRGQMNLLLDVANEMPEALKPLAKDFSHSMMDLFSEHSRRVEKEVADGTISKISFRDIVEDIVILTWMPFVFEPFLRNVAGMDDAAYENYIEHRKKETSKLLEARLKL